ncbi:TPA: NAD-dependent epimerase/dehydratase family protein, partial [Salmonella enterica subsp. enterica serovar 16:l,v:-]
MTKRVFVAGHNGMVGSALVRMLQQEQDIEIITRKRNELDLLSQQAVSSFFK